MKKIILFIFLSIVLNNLSAQSRYYGGGKHSSSHGGYYSGGKGSSHKGGHYVNRRTNNHYGKHKKH